MLRNLWRQSLEQGGGPRDRGSDARAPHLAAKPAVLGRGTVQALAVVGLAVILYGTLTPFEPAPAGRLAWRLPVGRLVVQDLLANVMIYVPVGLCLRLLVRRRGSSALAEWTVCLLAAGTLSYLAEVAQTVLARRVACWIDVAATLGGAAIGIAFAPGVQRLLRRQHAWLYAELRRQPFVAAAAGSVLLLVLMGLMPFDLHPSPRRLLNALEHLGASLGQFPWTVPGSQEPLALPAMINKLLAAAAHGMVAFLLVIAARSMGVRGESAVAYGLSRAVLLAGLIEFMQAFTVAHTLDGRDLLTAWACCGLGAATAAIVLRRAGGVPSAAGLVRGLVAVIGLAWMARLVARTLTELPSPGVEGIASWWPMAASFHRPWLSLLADYCTAAGQLGLLAGAIVLWYRAARLAPSFMALVAALLSAAAVGQVAAAWVHRPIDTAILLIALIVAWLAHRFDQALFGQAARPAAPPA